MADWTAEDVAAQFEGVGADPNWNTGTAKLVDGEWTYTGSGATASATRMQDIADRINAGTYSSGDLQNSLMHILNSGGSVNGTTTTLPPGTTTTTGGGVAEGIGEKTDEEKRREINLIYDWLPQGAIDLYVAEFIESGNADAAWAQIRKSSQYEEWFPGNLTEDGRVRYSEELYAAVVASYDDVFRAAGIDGQALEYMQMRYGDLIRGEVAPSELETKRVKPMYDRIVSQSEEIKRYYADNYGIGMSTTDLLVSAMDPALGDLVLSEQIKFAEIGGEAAESGFDMTADRVERLGMVAGFDRAAANELFQDAETMVPLLNTLAKRHNDPDDDFDLEEFISADVFADPDQMYRMRRMMSQERSMFSRGTTAKQDQAGALTGLLTR